LGIYVRNTAPQVLRPYKAGSHLCALGVAGSVRSGRLLSSSSCLGLNGANVLFKGSRLLVELVDVCEEGVVLIVSGLELVNELINLLYKGQQAGVT
jgi:hypothetical protein